jgi:hypothetical protein
MAMLATMTPKKDSDMYALRLVMMVVVAACGFGLAVLAATPAPADAATVQAGE